MLASSIYAGDPNVASHFAKGFYDVEENAWRWTGKEFAVDLSPPLHSDQKGAQLVMKLAVPDAVIQKLTSVQLSASIQGYKLEPQIYTKSGQYTYTRDVPADKLQSDVVRIDFALDHALAANRDRQTAIGDHRERSRAGCEISRSESHELLRAAPRQLPGRIENLPPHSQHQHAVREQAGHPARGRIRARRAGTRRACSRRS